MSQPNQEKRLYHVTFQVFAKAGTYLENKYYDLPAPFFPEEAKIAYMKEHPDRVIRRELIVVLAFSDQEENRVKYDWWLKKDAQLEKKRKEIEKKAASGAYGSGDDAQIEVKKALKEVRDDELN